MNQHLKQAIAAARAGKKPQAKVLLARVIKDEPENVNAWFLLSTLADTEEQKIQHLQKVLELQPDHPQAAQQLAELIPSPLEPAEEPASEITAPAEETPEDVSALDEVSELDAVTALDIESESEPHIPPPLVEETAEEIAASEDVPDDPDEAMAWLEGLAAAQGAPIDELPSMSAPSLTEDADEVEAEPEPEPAIPAPIVDEPAETAAADEDIPDDPDEAMAWLDAIAAEQDEAYEDMPTMSDADASEQASAETLAGLEDDDYSWLDEMPSEEEDDLEEMPTVIDEPEMGADEEEEAARSLTVSDGLDFVEQAEGDSIPAWLAEDEAFLSADTVVTEPAAEEPEEPEMETLPDWLSDDDALEGWEGEEGEKSGQVIWKEGDGDDMKPRQPGAAKAEAETKASVKKTAEPRDNTNLYLAMLVFIAIVLIVAILLILVFQPF